MAASLAVQQMQEITHDISDDEELSSANTPAWAAPNGLSHYRDQQRSSAFTTNSSSTELKSTPQSSIADTSAEDAAFRTTGRLSGLALNRAQMERERLARQAARQSQAQNAIASGSGHPGKSGTPGLPEAAVSTLGLTKQASNIGTSDTGTSRPGMASKESSNGVTRVSGPSIENGKVRAASKAAIHSGRSSSHPLQSLGPFPSDAAGEYYLEGEMRHTDLTIGEPSDVKTFAPAQMIGDVSCFRYKPCLMTCVEIPSILDHPVVFRHR